jgi:hypothetical protein
MEDRGGQSAAVGEGLLRQDEEVFKHWHQLRDWKMSRREFQAEVAPVEGRVKDLLVEGTGGYCLRPSTCVPAIEYLCTEPGCVKRTFKISCVWCGDAMTDARCGC